MEIIIPPGNQRPFGQRERKQSRGHRAENPISFVTFPLLLLRATVKTGADGSCIRRIVTESFHLKTIYTFRTFSKNLSLGLKYKIAPSMFRHHSVSKCLSTWSGFIFHKCEESPLLACFVGDTGRSDECRGCDRESHFPAEDTERRPAAINGQPRCRNQPNKLNLRQEPWGRRLDISCTEEGLTHALRWMPFWSPSTFDTDYFVSVWLTAVVVYPPQDQWSTSVD